MSGSSSMLFSVQQVYVSLSDMHVQKDAIFKQKEERLILCFLSAFKLLCIALLGGGVFLECSDRVLSCICMAFNCP